MVLRTTVSPNQRPDGQSRSNNLTIHSVLNIERVPDDWIINRCAIVCDGCTS